MEILPSNNEALALCGHYVSPSSDSCMDLSSDSNQTMGDFAEEPPSNITTAETSVDPFSSDLSLPPSTTSSAPSLLDMKAQLASESSTYMEFCSAEESATGGQIEPGIRDPSDESRVDLEYVENHMRHAGSNVGPFYESDMPVVLGRETFRHRDCHRVRGLVSRHHCRIESLVNVQGEVEYYVKDTSVNGTFLGPHRIDPSGPGALVQPGDVIGLLTSHSSPIETYDMEGTGFRVTLGVRWLRPNLLPHDTPSTSTPSDNKPVKRTYPCGISPFIGAQARTTMEESQEDECGVSSRPHDSSSNDHATTVSATPKVEKGEKKHSRASKSKHGVNGGPKSASKSEKRRRARDPSAKNHSGNDTDDTDGDDEMDLGQSSRAVSGGDSAKKPVVAVSRPTFDDDDGSVVHARDSDRKLPFHDGKQHPTSRKRSAARRHANRTDYEDDDDHHDGAATMEECTSIATFTTSTTSAATTRSPTPIMTSSFATTMTHAAETPLHIPIANASAEANDHWDLTPGASRKRSRHQRNNNGSNEQQHHHHYHEDAADDLASEEPAHKIRSE